MIQIIQEPSDIINNAFNNSILKFDSDNASAPKDATLVFTMGTQSFTVKIAPDTSNNFRYNLKEVASTFINDNNFADSQTFDETAILQDIIKDGTKSTYGILNVDITIDFLDESQENVEKNYKYLKSVEQVIDQRLDLFWVLINYT